MGEPELLPPDPQLVLPELLPDPLPELLPAPLLLDVDPELLPATPDELPLPELLDELPLELPLDPPPLEAPELPEPLDELEALPESGEPVPDTCPPHERARSRPTTTVASLRLTGSTVRRPPSSGNLHVGQMGYTLVLPARGVEWML